MGLGNEQAKAVPTDSTDGIDTSLSAIIQHSPIASVITNPRMNDNPIIACNAAFMELTGYDEDQIVGRNCRFLAGPDTEPWVTERISKAVSDRRPTLVEILNYKKDGTPFRNALLVAPLFDDAGQLEFFLGSQVELEEEDLGITSKRRRAAAQLIKGLSPRQREVLVKMANGLLNKQIAYELDLSEKTVKMHRSLLMQKLGVPTSADAVRIAVEAGL
jgi:PAS domain S-box-containing protein